MNSNRPSVKRVTEFLSRHDIDVLVRELDQSARTAQDAASALGVEVGQIASSIVFAQPTSPLLVITSGRHRVDTKFVEQQNGLEKLGRADADYVKNWSGFVIGGVSPIAWIHEESSYQPETFIDLALNEYSEIWAAAGHTHVVFKTNFADLMRISGAKPISVEP